MDVANINKLFEENLTVVNLGLESFAENLNNEGVKTVQVQWKPPAGGNMEIAELLDKMDSIKAKVDVDAANKKAAEIINNGKPTVVDISTAGKAIPGMRKNLFLHAGPPVEWERMSGPTRGAVIGGLVYEGLAGTYEEAEKMAASGEIDFEPCHHHATVGPMAGIVTYSMPVWVLENKAYGNKAYATLNEGLGKVLRYGAYGDDVIAKLKWMESDLAPILKAALKLHGELDMKNIIAQILQMGDEGHNRNRAGTSIVIRELAPYLVQLDVEKEKLVKVFEFLNANDHFFLNLSMPSAKCIIDAAAGIEGSTIVTTMARNGTDFGIRMSCTGDQWFTAPAPMVDGLYLPGYSADDAAPDIGDSTITETVGIGGFAMAAAPAIVKFVGGTPKDALNVTTRMYEITETENKIFQIPALDFRGTPTGIDVLKIIETGILPAVNTGIAHKKPGIGMVGAGLVKPPEKCFNDAFKAFVEKYS
ncbi:MAG: hypothetical protein DRP59_07210 [Spirochaetes bacterium]|nr:MAG: hypothetical protein DRP59_07210 [Spirochaetota bacterium]